MVKFRRFERCAFSWLLIEIETHSVERDICFIATAQWPHYSYNKGYIAHFYCACAKWPYFHFRRAIHYCGTQFVWFFVRGIHYQLVKIVLHTCSPRWSYSIYRTSTSMSVLVWFVSLFLKWLKHANLTIWLRAVIILHSFSYLNVHFQWIKLCWKTVVLSYVTLRLIRST